MDRGFQAVLAKLPTFPEGDVGALLKGVGMTLMSTVGGASGPLYGSFFLQLGLATAGTTALVAFGGIFPSLAQAQEMTFFVTSVGPGKVATGVPVQSPNA